MEQEEDVAAAAWVLLVERLDPAAPGPAAARHPGSACGRVEKVGQQAESAGGHPDWPGTALPALRAGARRPLELLSMVGTTTRCRDAGGMPSEKSIRGKGRGVTSSVASQLTNATAS
jgi:hypothetical protein